MNKSPFARDPMSYISRHHQKAFTLAEILIVIVIITIMFTLGTFALSGLQEIARSKSTFGVLSALSAAEVEYQAETSTRVGSAGLTPGTAFPEDDGAAYEIKSIAAFLKQVRNNSTNAKEILDKGISIDFRGFEDVDEDEDYDHIIDAWKNPIRYCPGTDTWPGSNRDLAIAGMPRHQTAYFASAGPDGRWGQYDKDTNEPIPDSGSEDNVYSFTIE